MTSSQTRQVGIIMGSDSDYTHMKEAADALTDLGILFDLRVVSAHRTPDEMAQYAKDAHAKGLRVIIAGAGGAAHLPGMVAAFTPIPVIGVPIPYGYLKGEDALLSIVQMPKGVPVATVAIGNSYNAGILAAQILAFGGEKSNEELQKRIFELKDTNRKKSLNKKLTLNS